jgi:hypothetical protein
VQLSLRSTFALLAKQISDENLSYLFSHKVVENQPFVNFTILARFFFFRLCSFVETKAKKGNENNAKKLLFKL